MKKLQYQIVRYLHDRVSGEFVNVGVIVFHKESSFLKGKFINKYSRISHFFNDVNGQYILNTLKTFEHELEVISKRLNELFTDYNSLSEITSQILPKDDSALICSELNHCVDIEAQSTLDDFYERIIIKHFPDPESSSKDDKYVWRKVYKQYFDKYNITKNLVSHTVETNNDKIEFDKAWKNGKWNCYQSLSFDLKRSDSIKNKVYRWSGILNELENTHKDLNIYFLTVNPSKRRNKSLSNFINQTLSQRENSSIKVELIHENEAEKFAVSVKKEIEQHLDSSGTAANNG